MCVKMKYQQEEAAEQAAAFEISRKVVKSYKIQDKIPPLHWTVRQLTTTPMDRAIAKFLSNYKIDALQAAKNTIHWVRRYRYLQLHRKEIEKCSDEKKN